MNTQTFIGTGRRLRMAVALLVALYFTFSYYPVAHATNPNMQIEVGNAAGTAGDTVAVAVYMDPGDHAFWQYQTEIAYDPDALEFVEATDDASSDTFQPVSVGSGAVQVSANIFGFVMDRQQVFTLHFKIKDTAAPGDTPITISSGTYTEDEDPIAVQAQNLASGKVSVTVPTGVTVGAGTVSGTAGSIVVVPVSVMSTNTAGIGSYGIQLDFDTNALEVTNITYTSGDYFYSSYDNTQGSLKAAWVDASGGSHPAVAEDQLFKITFHIKSGASLGDTLLTVNPVDVLHFTFTDESMNELDKTWVNGKVTVTQASEEDEEPTPSGTGTAPSTPSSTPSPAPTGVDVLVNGKPESAGIATFSTVNGQTVTTTAIDPQKLNDKLAASGQGTIVTIPVNTKSDVIIGELNGQMVKNMENKQAILEIKTGQATYTLPAGQINIDAISSQIGKNVALQDIKVRIEIAAPTADMVHTVENAAAAGSFTLVTPPFNFNVSATDGDTTIDVSKFNAYVERTIAIPDGVDPNKITTGVVVEPDGTVRHVPTKVVQADGKYYAQVNSLTNSTYSVVWHPLEFSDVANHWAQAAVNDMGSRMVISGVGNGLFNPDQDITRAEFAAIVVRGLGLKLESGAAPFSDVQAADWYNSAVNTAAAYHLVNGFEDGTFRPNETITREQAMAIIAKAMGITGLKGKLPAASGDLLQPFTDAASASSWAKDSIADVLQAGIVSGRTSTSLAPQAHISRAEVAAVVQRLLQKSGLI